MHPRHLFIILVWFWLKWVDQLAVMETETNCFQSDLYWISFSYEWSLCKWSYYFWGLCVLLSVHTFTHAWWGDNNITASQIMDLKCCVVTLLKIIELLLRYCMLWCKLIKAILFIKVVNYNVVTVRNILAWYNCLINYCNLTHYICMVTCSKIMKVCVRSFILKPKMFCPLSPYLLSTASALVLVYIWNITSQQSWMYHLWCHTSFIVLVVSWSLSELSFLFFTCWLCDLFFLQQWKVKYAVLVWVTPHH